MTGADRSRAPHPRARLSPAGARGLSPFAVVGPGRVGTALAACWIGRGLRCLGFFGRDPRRTRAALARAGQGVRLRSLAELSTAAVVVLAVPGEVLADVARAAAAAGAVRPGALWLHCSGFHDARPLLPLRRAGAAVGSLHPLCPFPDPGAGMAALQDCYTFIEGEPRARSRLRRLAALPGGQVALLPARSKPLYHAGAVLGSNYVVALLELASRCVAAALGGRLADRRTAERAVARLAAAAVRQCEAQGARAALTGPLRRGDALVVARHLRALARVPAAARVYAALGDEVVRWLAAEAVLPRTAVRPLRRALRGRRDQDHG